MATLIQKPGTDKWYVKIMYKGRHYERATGESDKRKALGKKSEVIAQIKAEADERSSSQIKISNAWDAWLLAPKRLEPSPQTLYGYQAYWRKFTGWLDKHRKSIKYLSDLDAKTAKDYASHLWSTGLSPGTFNKHRNLLANVFEVLRVQGGILQNPWNEVPTRKKSRRDKQTGRRALTIDELRAVLSNAEGDMKILAALGMFTGMRLGDCCTLKWSEIDIDTHCLRRKTRKTGRLIEIKINDQLCRMLEELKKQAGDNEYVLPAIAEKYESERTRITDRFQRLFAKCNIKVYDEEKGPHEAVRCCRVGFHSFRHSFVSICAANNVPLVVVESIVGHGNPETTRLYAHAFDEQKHKAIDAMPLLIGAGQQTK